MKELDSKLVQEIESRWDSNLKMLKSIQKNETKLKQIKSALVKPLVAQIDFDFIGVVINLLEETTKIRLQWSYDDKPTLDSVITRSLTLKKFVKMDPTCSFIRESSQLFCTIFDDKLFDKAGPIAKTACFLSPLNLRIWCRQTESFNRAEDFEGDIKAELKKFAHYIESDLKPIEQPNKKQKTDSANPSSSLPYGYEEDDDDDDDELLDAIEPTDKTESIIEEAEKYFKMVTSRSLKSWLPFENALDFWMDEDNQKAYPLLFKAAAFYLAIPATSLPCERLFAQIWNTVTKLRSNLKSETVSNLQFINLNQDLFSVTSEQLFRDFKDAFDRSRGFLKIKHSTN